MTLDSLKTALPGYYYLEIAQGSLRNDTVISMDSSTPFPAYSLGDKISPYGFANVIWDEEPEPGEVLKVIDIIHYTWEIPKSHLGHKVRLAVELTQVS